MSLFCGFVSNYAMASSLLDPRLAAIAAIILLASVLLSRKQFPTPPGPQGLPVLCNHFGVKKKESWKASLKWAKQQGMYSEK